MSNKKEQDKVVSQVYETYDYAKFSILPENRGQKDTKGIKERKIKTLQTMIDNGTWIDEMSRVTCNQKFQIVDGAHTFIVLKRNNKPIRYEITTASQFNEVTKRDLIGNVYSINSVTTSWGPSELFNAAIQVNAPLAVIMKPIIEDNDNYFLWTDLMGLLLKDGNFFMGRWRTVSMKTFEDPALVKQIQSDEFEWELKHFIKLNLKARIAARKGIVLKSAYDVLWNARDMVDPTKFRKALASLPENKVTSQSASTEQDCAKMMINHYNKSQGQNVETSAVMFQLRQVNGKNFEPLLIS